MTQAEKPNLVFVDDVTWDMIEQALSSEVRDVHGSFGYQKLYETGEITAAPLSGKVGWPALVLFDQRQNPIYFVSGGEEARLEYERGVTNHD